MKRLFVIVFVFALLAAVVVTCSTNQPADPSVVKFQEQLAQLQREITPLNCLHISQTSPLSPAFRAYREYYDLVFEGTDHVLGTFRSGDFVLTAQIFIPQLPRGTVFFMHGYLDHTGVLQHLIHNFLQQGFVVALYDLPGHGLSTGERASIESFSDYSGVFEDFLARCGPHLPPPYHLISHSTGSTIAFDYLSKNGTRHFERIIFLAPLVRYAYWHLSKTVYFLGKPFPLRTVPRRIPQTSADPEFLALIRIDPLQTFRVPLKWVGALYAWNRRIQDIATIPGTVLIIQGTRDKVVDWKYNIPFLEQKIETVTVAWLEGVGHQLVNARPTIRADVFELMNTYLEHGKN